MKSHAPRLLTDHSLDSQPIIVSMEDVQSLPQPTACSGSPAQVFDLVLSGSYDKDMSPQQADTNNPSYLNDACFGYSPNSISPNASQDFISATHNQGAYTFKCFTIVMVENNCQRFFDFKDI